MAAEVSRDSVTGGSANSRADFLDRGHKREGEEHGPARREPELRARLAVCTDTGRVIIGSPSDKTGT